MNGAFDGDLIRPLGLVTMNFGYAEYELDSFLERLGETGRVPESWAQRPIGQKLGLLNDAIRALGSEVQASLAVLLDEASGLLDRRNALIHGCLLAGGRIVSGRKRAVERHTSVEDLNALAEEVFAWKERLWSYRWRQVEPLLQARATAAPPNTSLERRRGR